MSEFGQQQCRVVDRWEKLVVGDNVSGITLDVGGRGACRLIDSAGKMEIRGFVLMTVNLL
jgi:hypothetical protein